MENKRGGARKGAGRKPLGKEIVYVYLSSECANHLREVAKKMGQTLSSTAEMLIMGEVEK